MVRFLISRSESSGLIDKPNDRSSHTVPTPRGGGVAFVVTFILAAIILGIAPIWLIPSCAAVAVLGFLDDRFSLRASVRLAVQALAAIASLGLLFHADPSGDTIGSTEIAFAIFAFFWIVWMTNLYNFLDGIDGHAALEAVIVSTALAVFSWRHGLNETAALLAIVGSSVIGFLYLNFPKAKIFMGDAGSTFLGFFFGAIAVSLHLQGIPIAIPIILLGTFIVDATYTLTVRFFSGKKVHLAHRDHAYQHAVQNGWSHPKATMFFAAITVFWLIPMAAVVSMPSVATSPHAWLLRAGLVTIAYLPLVGLQVYFRAGIERK